MSQRSSGMVFALLSAALFSTSGILVKPLLDAGWSSGSAVLARIAGAALLLLVPTVLAAWGSGRVLRANWRYLLAYGLFPVAGAQLGFYSAIQTLPVGIALLIEYLAPVYVVGWLWLRRGQRPGRLTVAGAAAAVIGLILVLDPFTGQGVDPAGVLWAFGSSCCVVVYFLLSASVSDDLPPVLVIGVGMVVGCCALALAGLVGLLPMAATDTSAALGGVTAPWWGYVIAMALVGTVLPYVTGIMAISRLGARLGAFVALAEVVFAALLAWLLLGQTATAGQVAGGILIISGVVLVRAGEPPPDPLKSAPDPEEETADLPRTG